MNIVSVVSILRYIVIIDSKIMRYEKFQYHPGLNKTDTFGIGVRIFLGHVNGLICPVKSLLSYLAVRGSASGHLFQFRDGSSLSRKKLVEAVQHALEVQGLDVHQFHGHSFQIGVATTAAAYGLEDSLIQTLSHWRLSAFTR